MANEETRERIDSNQLVCRCHKADSDGNRVDKRIFLDDNSRPNISQDETEEKPKYCDVDHINSETIWDAVRLEEVVVVNQGA
jgi:hypothetical protein